MSNYRRGPRRADGTAAPTRPVPVRLTAAELAEIDTARGEEETRSDFIRRHALRGARDGTPAGEAG